MPVSLTEHIGCLLWTASDHDHPDLVHGREQLRDKGRIERLIALADVQHERSLGGIHLQEPSLGASIGRHMVEMDLRMPAPLRDLVDDMRERAMLAASRTCDDDMPGAISGEYQIAWRWRLTVRVRGADLVLATENLDELGVMLSHRIVECNESVRLAGDYVQRKSHPRGQNESLAAIALVLEHRTQREHVAASAFVRQTVRAPVVLHQHPACTALKETLMRRDTLAVQHDVAIERKADRCDPSAPWQVKQRVGAVPEQRCNIVLVLVDARAPFLG